MINTVTKYIATKTIKIRKSSGKVFTVSMIWDDLLLFLTFSIPNNCILEILTFDTELNSEELDFIKELIIIKL
jgi:hypothetical protein